MTTPHVRLTPLSAGPWWGYWADSRTQPAWWAHLVVISEAVKFGLDVRDLQFPYRDEPPTLEELADRATTYLNSVAPKGFTIGFRDIDDRREFGMWPTEG